MKKNARQQFSQNFRRKNSINYQDSEIRLHTDAGSIKLHHFVESGRRNAQLASGGTEKKGFEPKNASLKNKDELSRMVQDAETSGVRKANKFFLDIIDLPQNNSSASPQDQSLPKIEPEARDSPHQLHKKTQLKGGSLEIGKYTKTPIINKFCHGLLPSQPHNA